jgi:5-methylcytosine-specific restriction protein A
VLWTVRDHVIPLAEGGPDNAENAQGLCENCHDRKTEQDAKRGTAKWR